MKFTIAPPNSFVNQDHGGKTLTTGPTESTERRERREQGKRYE
jgi:hypothetical protein